jgi:opacity protein-like surface antigen
MTLRFVRLLVLSAILVFAASAKGISLLGPPIADLKQGQFSLSAGYAYNDSEYKASFKTNDVTVDGARSNSFLAKPGYGINDDWKVYGTLGTSDFKEDGFNDGFQFAYGFGTKVTIEKFDKIAWGFIFDVGYRNFNDDSAKDVNGQTGFSGKIDYYDVTLAVGPMWDVTKQFHLYGGPFLYILKGHLNFDSANESKSFTLQERTMVGGYFGAEYDLTENSSVYGEYHQIGDGWLLGTGFNWKF